MRKGAGGRYSTSVFNSIRDTDARLYWGTAGQHFFHQGVQECTLKTSSGNDHVVILNIFTGNNLFVHFPELEDSKKETYGQEQGIIFYF